MGPVPVDTPLQHVTIDGGSGTYGDVRIDGTLLLGIKAATDGVPRDSRGAINLCRTLNGALIRGFLNGVERWRFGTVNGEWPFLKTGSNLNDQPGLRFREFPSGYKIEMCGEDGTCGEISKDNSGALKYQSPAGNVTTLAPGP